MTPNTSVPQNWIGLVVRYPYTARVELTLPDNVQLGREFTGTYTLEDEDEGTFTALISTEGVVTMNLQTGSPPGNWHFEGRLNRTMIVGIVTKEGDNPIAAMNVFTPEEQRAQMPGAYDGELN